MLLGHSNNTIDGTGCKSSKKLLSSFVIAILHSSISSSLVNTARKYGKTIQYFTNESAVKAA